MREFEKASPSHIKQERSKARELRQTRWWKEQINKGVCYYCEDRFGSEDLNMDHKVPVIRGGRSVKSNVVVSCKECNSKKSYKTPVDMILEDLENQKS